jgi:ribonuclease P/MRP protein subunit RPP40
MGVIVQNDINVSEQRSKVVKTANHILGMIRRTFLNRSKEIIIPLYKFLVRPHLEYCVQVWRPHLIKDIKLIKNVQHRTTRMIPELHGKT